MFGLGKGKTRLNSAAKIFCIGLSGTGTRSLHRAMRLLGLSSCHYPQSLEDFARHQVLLDIPVACRYRELDIMFPGSRFILTTRELESWLDNRSRKPPDRTPPSLWVQENRLRTYGVPAFDRELYRVRHKQYHDGVHEYFKDRPGDLMVMSVVEGDGWDKLCPFLGVPVPIGQPFPTVRNAHSPVR